MTAPTAGREAFATRAGFILAAAGSAVGQAFSVRTVADHIPG